MSIQSEITRITQMRDASLTAVSSKGVTVPSGSTIDDLPDLIDLIEDMNAQAKTVTPTFSAQVIAPDTGYNCLSQVTVNAITVTYSDNAAGGKTVTIGAV